MSPVLVNGQEPQTAAPPPAPAANSASFRHRTEYIFVKILLAFLGSLPHAVARGFCRLLGALTYLAWGRLRKVGIFNLGLAFPEWNEKQKRTALRGLFRGFGRMLADFARFPRLHRGNIDGLIIYDGFEAFAQAKSEGKGVLFLTAHFGNWELSSFAHGVYGHPLGFLVREIDNPLVDALINSYRCLSGGRAIEKRDAAREVLRAFHRGEAIGILSDQNMLAGDGAFVDFFGIPACTTTAPARFVRKTGAAVVFGFAIWDEKLKKYRLRFERIPWIHREDPEEEVLANTRNFSRLLEEQVRHYPDQWLWVHRRWKTRPPGEPPLYTF